MDTVPVVATDLRYRYGRRVVLDGLDLRLHTGVSGLLGPNGAGKTTLMTLLAGLRRPRSGTLLVHGQDMSRRGAARKVAAGTGYLPQDFGYLPAYTVAEFVGYAAWLKGLKGNDTRPLVAEALDAVGLSARNDSKMRTLSGGMRRRAGIAAAIVHRPALLLLDEPTAGLDPAQRLELRDVLLGLRERTAVLLSTHLTDDIRATCDTVYVINEGGIRFQGSPAELARRSHLDGPTATGQPAGGDASELERGYLASLGAGRDNRR